MGNLPLFPKFALKVKKTLHGQTISWRKIQTCCEIILVTMFARICSSIFDQFSSTVPQQCRQEPRTADAHRPIGIWFHFHRTVPLEL